MPSQAGGEAEEAAGRRRGRVMTFDAERGLGTVQDVQGREIPFHCTAIADGTRTIDPGTEVSYQLRPGHRGRWEAGDVHPA
jgi:cold shock CspA family protein